MASRGSFELIDCIVLFREWRLRYQLAAGHCETMVFGKASLDWFDPARAGEYVGYVDICGQKDISGGDVDNSPIRWRDV